MFLLKNYSKCPYIAKNGFVLSPNRTAGYGTNKPSLKEEQRCGAQRYLSDVIFCVYKLVAELDFVDKLFQLHS
jgi:hypothetical protein